MKRFIPLLLLLINCSTSLYRINTVGALEHQCFTPIPVLISTNVPIEERMTIVESLAWWNKYKSRLFFLVGLTDRTPDDPSAIAVTIGYPASYTSDGNTLAKTSILSYKDGCIISSHIRLIEPLGSYSPEVAKLIVIHELGHILGLDHNTLLNSIMRSTISVDRKWQPNNLTKEELEALESFY